MKRMKENEKWRKTWLKEKEEAKENSQIKRVNEVRENEEWKKKKRKVKVRWKKLRKKEYNLNERKKRWGCKRKYEMKAKNGEWKDFKQ